MILTAIDPLERVQRLVDDLVALDVSRVTPLVGDASNRAYFRLALAGGGTRIVALLPEVFAPESLPFLNVASLFEMIPIRIPRVHFVSGERGALVMEDLGDNLLQNAVEDAPVAKKTELYRHAVDILVRLQQRGDELASDDFVPYQTRFDVEKFMWELSFFRKHYLEGLRGRSLDDAELAELDARFRELAGELCEQPFVLCHRDYHARNLMVPATTADELVVIDFQDARQGPRAYDLVSLLNDSYVSHTPDFVDAMTERFERAVGASVARDYDAAALQRNLKALGTFGYQIGACANAVYERYVDGTLSMVRANLERNPRWDSLRRILARHCEEIG